MTGSARGIGRATAELLAEHGARVLVNDLDADLAAEASQEIGRDAVSFAGDLTKTGSATTSPSMRSMPSAGWTSSSTTRYTWDGPLHKLSDEHFQAMLDIHNVVPFRVLQAAAPHMAAMLIPLGRPATTEEAAASSSCAHPGPTTCTGQVLNVTGGQFTGMAN